MAGFEGVRWASKQMRYVLEGKEFDVLEADSKVFAVSRSLHYGLFLAFEGIRFFCRSGKSGQVEVVFLNWEKNLERFRRGISFNLSSNQQGLVPGVDEMENLFIRRYFQDPAMIDFLSEMAALGAQGYLRPFTVDEEQSIGVTFPGRPSIRAVACRYDRYLGEPFCGVVVPHIVRAIDINRTGCLKLGVNYLMSVKAVDEARKICSGAASALFLDDRPHLDLEQRIVTEWDSSCCLFAWRDGTVVKIPESNLILPSVTILGMVAILGDMGIRVEERNIAYGELIERVRARDLVTACSVGTAGILNRCRQLNLVDAKNRIIAVHEPDESHPLYAALGKARTRYWDVYRQKAGIPAGMKLYRYAVGRPPTAEPKEPEVFR